MKSKKKAAISKTNRDCPLSVDGWISFLQTRVESSRSFKLAMLTLIFAVVAILISISVVFLSDLTIIYTIFMSIFFSVLCWYYTWIVTKRMDVAEKLLIEILKGKIINSNKIRDNWFFLLGKK